MAQAPTKNPLYAALHAVKASDLLKADRKPVVVLGIKDSVEKAVSTLSAAKILSAPVRGEDGSILGFVDMLDIARYIIAATPNVSELKADVGGETFKIAGRAIALVPLSNVVDFSARDPLITVYETSPASVPSSIMAKGVHRVALFAHDMSVNGIISQSDIVRFLGENLPRGHMKAVGERSLAALGYASSKVETIGLKATVLEALQLIVKAGVSALAVVDHHGHLVGNFSASDLRGLYGDRNPDFLYTVERYLKEHSADSLKPIVCMSSDTLTQTVNTLVKNRLHHLWIVNEGKPVGVLSGTDICKIVMSSGIEA
jgi:CBS domain-containing protein